MNPKRSAATVKMKSSGQKDFSLNGEYLLVKVIPRARKEEIVGFRAGELVIKVAVAPEKGQANERVIALIAEWLRVAQSRIELTSGATSRHKKFKIN